MAKTEKIHFILEQVRQMLLPAYCCCHQQHLAPGRPVLTKCLVP